MGAPFYRLCVLPKNCLTKISTSVFGKKGLCFIMVVRLGHVAVGPEAVPNPSVLSSEFQVTRTRFSRANWQVTHLGTVCLTPNSHEERLVAQNPSKALPGTLQGCPSRTPFLSRFPGS